MFDRLGQRIKLAAMDVVRCTLARICQENVEAGLWLQGAGVDVDRLGSQKF